MSIKFYQGDIPASLEFGDSVAIDTETQGLHPHRDRLCLIQLSSGDGSAHLVQFAPDSYEAPNLKKLLGNESITKIFHYARFDLAIILRYLGVDCRPVYCTRVASRLARTYTDKHGLKDICAELLDIEISKQQQQTDWAAETLTEEQLQYAAADVRYLHRLKEILDRRLQRENRTETAQACFNFLPYRAAMDLDGWTALDIFAH